MQVEARPTMKAGRRRLHPAVAAAAALAALTFQVSLPRYFTVIGFFDFPLLIVVYLALSRRNVIAGILTGAAIGLAQDALTHGPVGLFGIIKSVIGYLTGSLSLVIEVDYPGARGILVAVSYLLHQLLLWTMETVLLGNEVSVDLLRALIVAAAHAGLAGLLYRPLDRLKS